MSSNIKVNYPFVLTLRFGPFCFLTYAVVFRYSGALTTFIRTYSEKLEHSPK